MVADERGLELAILHEDLQKSIFSCHRLLAAKRKIVKKNRTLRQRVRELEDHLASLESHVSELEEETTELRKENEAVLGRDDDHQEAFDEEPASTDDDDQGSKSGDNRNAILDFYAPETPSEEDCGDPGLPIQNTRYAYNSRSHDQCIVNPHIRVDNRITSSFTVPNNAYNWSHDQV
jgi:TolA-binding protein